MATHEDPLRDLFITFGNSFPQDDNLFLERCVYDQVSRAGTEADGVSIEDVVVSTNGLKVPCKWFRPAKASQKQVIMFMHGGGFSFGSPNGHRKLTAHLAKESDTLALSVDYRLSPENRFPAAIDDCVAAYQFLLDQGFSPSSIAFAGDSCGGCLSTAVPLACVQRNIPVPAASVALSPCYDVSTVDGGTMDSNEEVDVLNAKPFCKKLSDRYVEGTGIPKTNPLVSPLFMEDKDVAKLPPHWISAAGYDMLCDHGEKMQEKLKRNGVEVELRVHPKQQHVFEFAVGNSKEADESVRNIGEWIRRRTRS